GPDVEQGAVPRALYGAGGLVELTLGERPVVVRAAVLDRVEGAAAVEDPDLEVLPLDQPHLAGLELGGGAHFDGLRLGQVAFVPKSYRVDRIYKRESSEHSGGLPARRRVRP